MTDLPDAVLEPGTLGLIWAQARPADAATGTPALLGRAGTLAWHLPEDLAHFRDVTFGHPVVMGRATWDSLPERFRPLPGRENLVLTRSRSWRSEGAIPVPSVEALRAALAGRAAWGIGGAQVYTALLDTAVRLEVTEVDLDTGPPQPGDVAAPAVPERFAPVNPDAPWLTSRTGLRYRHLRYLLASG